MSGALIFLDPAIKPYQPRLSLGRLRNTVPSTTTVLTLRRRASARNLSRPPHCFVSTALRCRTCSCELHLARPPVVSSVRNVYLLAIRDATRCNNLRSARRGVLAKARVSRTRNSVVICKPRDARDDDRDSLRKAHHVWPLRGRCVRRSASIAYRTRTHCNRFVKPELSSCKQPHTRADDVRRAHLHTRLRRGRRAERRGGVALQRWHRRRHHFESQLCRFTRIAADLSIHSNALWLGRPLRWCQERERAGCEMWREA